MLVAPTLVITPPSREPSPGPHPAISMERRPPIAGPPPRPARKQHRPVVVFDSPMRTSTPTLQRRWHVAGRTGGWQTSLIHDAADDAYMASFDTAFDVGIWSEGPLSGSRPGSDSDSGSGSGSGSRSGASTDMSDTSDSSDATYEYTEETEGEVRAEVQDASASTGAYRGRAWRTRTRKGRLPPPVRPLDLPGSRPGHTLEAVQNESQNRPNSSWWSRKW
ncbi:hypothetical protein CspeluHIS016_0105460 [Cutaneotrichosporon spelunceum]|uniref:Uncharacterized protein n=1 Tax=Cutaneotrichosporon spelunceum TaxID=1672016 RepID=A0AAD3Y7Z1_9TREE|nr:hypothetical protein CspeluHIS016_0105460 [Cutaneotrichosporon spelunceum]